MWHFLDVSLKSLFDLCSFLFSPPHHLKEALFPFIPFSIIILMFQSFHHIPGLPVPPKAMCSNADRHLCILFSLPKILFLLFSPPDAAFSTWVTLVSSISAKPSRPPLPVVVFVLHFASYLMVWFPSPFPPHPEMQSRDHVLPILASLGASMLPAMG